jgi:hypothetical protein
MLRKVDGSHEFAPLPGFFAVPPEARAYRCTAESATGLSAANGALLSSFRRSNPPALPPSGVGGPFYYESFSVRERVRNGTHSLRA